MPPPTAPRSWRILEDTTSASKLTASRKVMKREAAGSPTAGIAADMMGTDSHDANDIESTTIDRVADIMNPLQIAPDRFFSGTTMSLSATSDRAYAQTIKELWVPNTKYARSKHCDRTRLEFQSKTRSDASETVPIKLRTQRRVLCFRRASSSSRSLFLRLPTAMRSWVANDPLPLF